MTTPSPRKARPSMSSSFAVGRPSRAAPQHLIPSKEPECGRFIARVLTQIPEPRQHGLHYFGFYSSRARALRKDDRPELQPSSSNNTGERTDQPSLSPKQRAALRKRWANLIRRVYKTDPLICECGGRLPIISFITEPKVIARILEHLDKRNTRSPDPPQDNLRAPSGSS